MPRGADGPASTRQIPTHRSWVRGGLAFVGLALVGAAEPVAPPISVKVVVVTTFEVGADTGDQPGEFQYWVEREHLDQTIKVPGMDHVVRTDGNGLAGGVSGTTVPTTG